MKSLEQGTRIHNRKYEDHGDAGRSKAGNVRGHRGVGSQPSETVRSKTTEELAREINSNTTEYDNSQGHRGSQRQLQGYGGMSRYGSSVTVLPPEGGQLKPHKALRSRHQAPDLDPSQQMDPKESLAPQKVVSQVDFRNMRRGIPNKPPTKIDHGHGKGSTVDKPGKSGHVYQVSMADIPRAGQNRAARRRSSHKSGSPVRGPTPVFGQDNQINYKLMEKVPVTRLAPADVRCLEEAIQNLEACIPT